MKTCGDFWEPRECCIKQKKFDKRTPGLFKIEWQGEGMIGLCSKTYFGWGDKNKCSTKGISKTQNTIDKEQFLPSTEDETIYRWSECWISSEGQCSVHISPATGCLELLVSEVESHGRWNHHSIIINLKC